MNKRSIVLAAGAVAALLILATDRFWLEALCIAGVVAAARESK